MTSIALLVACGGAGPSSPSMPTSPSPTATPSLVPASPILNIESFLDTCPTNDPAYARIRADLRVRRNGVLVGDIPCIEPATAMPIAEWSDELIALQAFRVLYHMDAGLTNHLPWTAGSAYQWFVSRVGGVNIRDRATLSSCCEVIGSIRHITLVPSDEANRNFDRNWEGLSGNVALFLHEARHVDSFPHVSCCGIQGGCDQTYDERNLSPYGMQYWINRAWLTGAINVGVGCLGPSKIDAIAKWQLDSANVYLDRFCDLRPPLLGMPTRPGGVCRK